MPDTNKIIAANIREIVDEIEDIIGADNDAHPQLFEAMCCLQDAAELLEAQ